jgi:hypothetical protein
MPRRRVATSLSFSGRGEPQDCLARYHNLRLQKGANGMPVYKNNEMHTRLVREERQIPEFFPFAEAKTGRMLARQPAPNAEAAGGNRADAFGSGTV